MGERPSLDLDRSQPLSAVVVGASGDLSMRKIFPALFALYCQDLLPREFHVVGFSRSQMGNDAFRGRIMEHLTCRYVPGEKCGELMDAFLARCTYVSGNYNSVDSFRQLHTELQHLDPQGRENRIFYMAIPPFLFLDVAHALADAGLVHRDGHGGWGRVVIEKPFGSDLASSNQLTESMAKVFTEDQTYRIDHYLGKEVIQNLMVLRFANLIFDPIWDRNCIHDVRISWMENLSLEGRAGYFDEYGIVRDVMQNHLLQMLALVAMEPPVALNSHYVRDEKVKALRCVAPLTLNDVVVGQYTAGAVEGHQHSGYREEEGVPAGSRTPTYAAAVLQIRNRRWDGVPFLIRAGKGLHTNMTEIRIRFHDVPGNIFRTSPDLLTANELVIRVQPNAAISFRIMNKVPGLGIKLAQSDLDLSYEAAFGGKIPDAYESLLLDVIKGDKSLFIRSDELAAAWQIFTPVLHELEARRVEPEKYTFGSEGPPAANALAARFNARW
ncbi:MAG: glucose-6-phosphate dehydrogenase [Candidatus Hydrogenedentes bacterium]|nr:glucose-6-phosphate dehydrogenase [Candidatus Hydrogenedentota bacterium]